MREKKERNQIIVDLIINKNWSFRKVQKEFNFNSVSTVYAIYARYMKNLQINKGV